MINYYLYKNIINKAIDYIFDKEKMSEVIEIEIQNTTGQENNITNTNDIIIEGNIATENKFIELFKWFVYVFKIIIHPLIWLYIAHSFCMFSKELVHLIVNFMSMFAFITLYIGIIILTRIYNNMNLEKVFNSF